MLRLWPQPAPRSRNRRGCPGWSGAAVGSGRRKRGRGAPVVWSGVARHADQGGGNMPPEQDDVRARQLEALRRYVAELRVPPDRPTVEATEPQPTSERQRRPSPPWLLLTGLLVVVALVGGVLVGAVAWSDERPT